MAYICSGVFFAVAGEYDSDIRTQVWDTTMVVLIVCIYSVKFEETDFWIQVLPSFNALPLQCRLAKPTVAAKGVPLPPGSLPLRIPVIVFAVRRRIMVAVVQLSVLCSTIPLPRRRRRHGVWTAPAYSSPIALEASRGWASVSGNQSGIC